MPFPLFDYTIEVNNLDLGGAGILLSSEQSLEAQIFGDIAHLILDFATIIFS